MPFVYHQICKKNYYNHAFPLCTLLSTFAENWVCLLTFLQERSYSFTCGSCGTQTPVDFDNIAIPGAVQYIRKKRKLWNRQEELRKLHYLPNLIKIKIKQKIEKKIIATFA